MQNFGAIVLCMLFLLYIYIVIFWKAGLLLLYRRVLPSVPNPRFVPHLWVFHYCRVWVAAVCSMKQGGRAKYKPEVFKRIRTGLR